MLLRRRDVLYAAVGLSACKQPVRSPAAPLDDDDRRTSALPWGIQIGDVTATSAVIWTRTTQRYSAQMTVEIGRWGPLHTRYEPARIATSTFTAEENDFTCKALLRGLEPGHHVRFRARCEDSGWEYGSFTTAPVEPRPLRLAFSGDTNGQGWGIDPARGGMPAYRVLEREAPDLFIHLGDTIYADNPIPPALDLPDGTKWNNLLDPHDASRSHVAETLADYRGAHRYPRLSAEVRAASAKVPIAAVWDDHEVRNNWFPGEVIEDKRYTEKRIDVMAAHARRAMYEYLPTLRSPAEPMYRVLRYGPLADVFMLDGRTFRTPNDPPPTPGAMLGPTQEKWLVDELRASRAKWKIVASNMPIGLVIGEPAKQVKWAADGWGNEGTGEPTEREVELARILTAIRGVKNMVWLGADVHYAAAHRFEPTRAAYKDFDPFWELIAGPMHATAFGRKNLDPTFGPALEWCSVDWDTRGSPADGRQYIGVLDLDPARPDLQVRWLDARGNIVHLLSIAAQ